MEVLLFRVPTPWSNSPANRPPRHATASKRLRSIGNAPGPPALWARPSWRILLHLAQVYATRRAR